MNVHRITLTLKEPATIGNGAAVSNEMRTREVIPATVLRGAIYEELRLAGLQERASAWFGRDGPHWSDAWPEGCVPMPRSFMKVKRDEGFAGFGVWNDFSTEPRPLQDDHGAAIIWQRLNDPWLRVEQGAPCGSDRSRTRVDMHVSLHYASQSARPAALFSRETLQASQTYYAYISSLPPQGERDAVREIALGKRHSVNGRAEIGFSDAAEPAFGWQRPADESGSAYVQLMSPALVPGRHGGWLRGLDADSLRDLGLDACEVCGFSTFAEITGWNGFWHLPKEQHAGIGTGSCWRITADPGALSQWLDTVERDGLGLRRHEGFGWVAVNPPWLSGTLNQRIRAGATGTSTLVNPRPWPGFSESDWPDLLRLDQFAAELARKWKPDRSRAVQQALSLVRQAGVNGPALPRRAHESDVKPWTNLKGALTDNRWPGTASQQAFLLSAVLVKLRAEEEKLTGGQI
ncbi:MAG: hypothetical protein ABSH47_20490 [Bryobacteraceae bacterium]|jgi:hypothetical protein